VVRASQLHGCPALWDRCLPGRSGMGATNVPRTNIAFVWESVAPADSYDFELSRTPTFTPRCHCGRADIQGYTYTGAALAYDTPYYWRVTAIQDGAPGKPGHGYVPHGPETPPAPEVT
jgi:hypothetical protein